MLSLYVSWLAYVILNTYGLIDPIDFVKLTQPRDIIHLETTSN